eukprot:4594245-Prymnesium_polylepis.1
MVAAWGNCGSIEAVEIIRIAVSARAQHLLLRYGLCPPLNALSQRCAVTPPRLAHTAALPAPALPAPFPPTIRSAPTQSIGPRAWFAAPSTRLACKDGRARHSS